MSRSTSPSVASAVDARAAPIRRRVPRSRTSKHDPFAVPGIAETVQDASAEPARGGRERSGALSGSARSGIGLRASASARRRHIDTTAAPGTPRSPATRGPADRRADVHHGMGPVGRPIHRHRRVRQSLHLDRAQQPGLARDDPPEDAAHVRVDRADRQPERQRRDGPRGIRPDARQRLEVGQIGGHPAAVLVDDPSRRAPQVERAPVVAEALPGPEDVGRRRGGQRLDGREPVHEPGPRVARPGGLGLLGHRLGHEDRVRVRAAAERKGSGRARRTSRGSRRGARAGSRAGRSPTYDRRPELEVIDALRRGVLDPANDLARAARRVPRRRARRLGFAVGRRSPAGRRGRSVATRSSRAGRRSRRSPR